jgi:ribonuclease P protein component
MLASKYRFHGPHSLRFVYRNGETAHSHICKIKYVYSKNREEPRFAIVISKKVHKSAVGRNQIRRRFYEVIQRQLPYIKKGVQVVVIVVSGEALSLTIDEANENLQQLFHEADLYE